MTEVSPSIQRIYEQQQKLSKPSYIPSSLHPEVLVVACIDARKNLHDIGFGEEDTLTLRNIAATIVKNDGSPESQSQEAALKEAIDSGIKHIVVMGHTSCGGLEEACACAHVKALPAVHQHLGQYQDIRNELLQKHCNGNIEELPAHMHAMEHEMGERAVRLSLDNLRSYDVVREAEAAGLQVHGWVMNTANSKIKEWHPDKGHPDGGSYGPIAFTENQDSHDVINRIRNRQQLIRRLDETPDSEEPPPHNPSMLVISEMAAPINPQKLNIQPGDALIYRAHDPCHELLNSQKAAIQFAIKAKKVKDVVVMLPFDEINRPVQEEALRNSARNFAKWEDFPVTEEPAKMHYWLINKASRRIFEMVTETSEFRAMAKDTAQCQPR